MKYSFRKYQPLSLRIWHWLNMIAILGLLGTVVLRKTFLSFRANSLLIKTKLEAAGTSITPDLAKDIAIAIRNPMWDWHIYLGFALGIFVVGRILIAMFVEKKSPIAIALKSLSEAKSLPSTDRAEGFRYAFVKVLHAIFYIATALMVVTGFMLYFKENFGFTKEFVTIVKEVHEIMQWFFVFFVVGHIMGVVIDENTKDPGLISDMINGGDPKLK